MYFGFCSDPLSLPAVFYYSKEAHIDTSALLYPYYLVTESSVLLLTADLKSSILLDKADVVEQYLREAEKQFQSAAPFLFMRREPEEFKFLRRDHYGQTDLFPCAGVTALCIFHALRSGCVGILSGKHGFHRSENAERQL